MADNLAPGTNTRCGPR